MATCVNISAYKFIQLEKIATLRVDILKFCNDHQILGTILLSEEGVNINLAASRENIDAFIAYLHEDMRFSDIEFKESYTQTAPFSHMRIKLKKEIIAMGMEDIKPPSVPEHAMTPLKLKELLDNGEQINILDTRNDYEYKIGSFENAIKLDLQNFRQFPKKMQAFTEEEKEKTTLMFCTGGVRCEKAMPMLQQAGFKNIFQLHGGILKYFEECGGAHWQGECFVFDDRIAIDSDLKPTKTKLCAKCQMPVTQVEQNKLNFEKLELCEQCAVAKC